MRLKSEHLSNTRYVSNYFMLMRKLAWIIILIIRVIQFGNIIKGTIYSYPFFNLACVVVMHLTHAID